MSFSSFSIFSSFSAVTLAVPQSDSNRTYLPERSGQQALQHLVVILPDVKGELVDLKLLDQILRVHHWMELFK